MLSIRNLRIFIVLCALSATSSLALAQDNPNLEEGIKPYGDFHGGNIDSINLGSGGLTVTIPIKSFPQRGKLTLPVTLRYNSKLWSNVGNCGTNTCKSSYWSYGDNQVSPGGNGIGQGTGNTASSPVYVTYTDEASIGCGWRYVNIFSGWLDFEIIDCTAYSPDGSTHIMAPLYNKPVAIEYQASNPPPIVTLKDIPYKAIDGSGIYGTAALTNESLSPGSPIYALGYYTMNRDGIYYGVHSIPSSASEDADGNYISYVPSSGHNTTNITDSRGLAISTISNDTSSNGNSSLCDSSAPIAIVKAWAVTGQNGLAETFTFCYTTLQIQTQFPTYPGTTMKQFKNATNNNIYALHSVALPSGDMWVFSYDSYADITDIQFPTGATISYTYETRSLCDLSNLLPASNIASFIETNSWTPYSRFVTSRTLDGKDGTGPHEWQYTWGTEVTTSTSRNFNVTVTDPDGNDTIHTETGASNSCSFYETSEKEYQGSASNNILLKEVDTNYSSMSSPANHASWATAGIIDAVNVEPTSVTTKAPTSSGHNQVKQVQMDYDYPFQYYYTDWDSVEAGPFQGTYGDVSQKREYDWGIDAPGPLLRKTTTKYEYDVNSAYANYMAMPYSVQVQDGSGNQVAYTQYGYDEFTPTPTGITTQVLTGIMGNVTDTFPADPLPSTRGHQTSVTKTVLPSNTTLRSCNTYFDTGMQASASDWLSTSANCSGANWTQYSYNSAYAGAYRTKTQKPTTGGVTHIVSGGYDLYTGKLTSFTDENNATSNYSYSDQLERMTDAHVAVGTTSERWTHISYPSLLEIDIDKDQNSKGDGLIQSQQIYDGVGRILSSRTLSDSAGAVWVDTTYDALGRVHSKSNPYRPSVAASTDFTTYGYDALGRTLFQCNPDNGTGVGQCNARGLSTKSWTYSGNVSTFYDENGGAWQRTSDALDRLISVIEPNGISKSPNMVTNYTYDAQNNPLKVNQLGSSANGDTPRIRTFNYDSLSRLLCASNPENSTASCPATNNGYVAGTIGYVYDFNGNVVTRTDARGVVTNYKYDALNRLYAKTYSNAPAGTVSSCYQYDTTVNGVGRMAAEWTQAGNCSSTPPVTPPAINQSLRVYGAYDAMGRALTELQCAAGYCTTASVPSQPAANCTTLSSATGLQYCYDLAGDLLAYSNGLTTQAEGQYPQHAISFAQTFDAAGHLNSVSSSWSDATHPQSLFSAPTYTPFNALSNWLLGTQLTTTRTYDNRLRVTGQSSAQ